MERLAGALGAMGALLITATAGFADPVDDTLVINEETEMMTEVAAPGHLDGALQRCIGLSWCIGRSMSAPERHGNVGMIPAQWKVMCLDRPVCKPCRFP